MPDGWMGLLMCMCVCEIDGSLMIDGDGTRMMGDGDGQRTRYVRRDAVLECSIGHQDQRVRVTSA
jgi:hypothetical protein